MESKASGSEGVVLEGHVVGERVNDRKRVRRNGTSDRSFWAGQKVVDGNGEVGIVVKVSYHSVKVWNSKCGVCDYLRPTPTSIAPAGASTIADLRPADSSAAVAKKLLRLVDLVEAFSVSEEEVAIKCHGSGLRSFSRADDSTKALSRALDMAIESVKG